MLSLRIRSVCCSLAMLVVAQLLFVEPLSAQTVARCGKGWLELIDGYPVLHLKGSPREMGFQHGALLRDKVTSNMRNLLEMKGNETLIEFGPIKVKPRQAIESIIAIQDRKSVV